MLIKKPSYILSTTRCLFGRRGCNKVIFRLCSKSVSGAPDTLMDHLKQRMKATGPITVASYMKECLTNPMFGYYMKNDVFGTKGDFTTSPEISQMFGELVAIWFLSQWMQLGKPSGVQLVELGPGRGSLMSDVLRVLKQFTTVSDHFNVHLVEVSEKMIEMQKKNLNTKEIEKNCAVTKDNVKVYWHDRIQDVPPGLSFYIAHEFFDALPVHLFRKIQGKGWREILVHMSSRDQDTLEFVTAPGPSPLGKSFIEPTSRVTECEICPDAALIMSNMTENIAKHDGCGLIIDYGVLSSDRFSVRGFKEHMLHTDILSNAGQMDLTANVDFAFLQRYSHEQVKCHGPIIQQQFLLRMGIRERMKALLKKATKEQAESLFSSYEYLTSLKKMGEKFKIMALTRSEQAIPPCFEEL